MTRRELLAAMPLSMATATVHAQRYIDGVFVHDGGDPIELLAYATPLASGRMELAQASFDDVPVLSQVRGVLCSIPNWKPVRVWAGSKMVFRDDRATRRELRFQVRQLNIYALDLRVPDVDQPAGVARLFSQVRAAPDNPLFLFVTMTSDRVVRREYMVQLSIAA
jgi:hypothetical protein